MCAATIIKLLLLVFCLGYTITFASSEIISWESYEDFRLAGWFGIYSQAKLASDLPADFTGNVRDLPGSDLWYYHAKGDPVVATFSWNATNLVINSNTVIIRLRYYTSASVTIVPVRDIYLEKLDITTSTFWGEQSSNIDLNLSVPSQRNQIVLTVMPGAEGYLVFDQITLEYEDTSTTDFDLSTSVTSISTQPTVTDTQITFSTKPSSLSTQSSPYTTELSTMSTQSPTSLSTESSSHMTGKSTVTESSTLSISEAASTTMNPTSSFSDESTIFSSGPQSSSTDSLEITTKTFTTEYPENTTFQTSTAETSSEVYPTTTTATPVLPGDKCLPNYINCSTVPYTACVSDFQGIYRCTCIEGTDLSLNCDRCIPRAEAIGSPCESSTQCLKLPGTDCVVNEFGYKYCFCIDDQVSSGTKKYCLDKIYELGLECREDIQCVAGLVTVDVGCSHGICMCHPQFVPSSEKTSCLQITNYRQSCEDSTQCIAGIGRYGTCDETKTCTCSQGSEYFRKLCHKIIAIGNQCQEHEECILGSNFNLKAICGDRDNICQCSRDGTLIEWEGSCYEHLLVGDLCTNEEDCMVSIEGPVYCDPHTKRCTCTDEKKTINGGQACSGNGLKHSHFHIYLLICLYVKYHVSLFTDIPG